MAASPKPTAVVCGNPYLAAGAFLESQAMGLRVPSDVSIVGYDDIELLSELPVPITTVRVQSDQVGRYAARFIVGKVEGKPAEIVFECPAEIIVRESSGPAPR
jgi:LacI family transcriptional regulator